MTVAGARNILAILGEGALTLGEAICRALSARCATGGAGRKRYLGGDEGRETALGNEAHLGVWHSISFNCPLAA